MKTIGFLFAAVLFITSLYIGINLFIKNKAIRIPKEEIQKEISVALTDNQMQIASYIFIKDKNPRFKHLLLLQDMFSVKNNVARYTAELYLSNDEHIKTITTTEWRFIIIATTRYIVKHIDYRNCYNYFFSKCYFGRKVFGLQNASAFYFNKNSTDLTEAEFTKLCLLIMNPAKYDFLPSSIDSDKVPS